MAVQPCTWTSVYMQNARAKSTWPSVLQVLPSTCMTKERQQLWERGARMPFLMTTWACFCQSWVNRFRGKKKKKHANFGGKGEKACRLWAVCWAHARKGEENEASWATGLAAGLGRLCSWACFCLLGPAKWAGCSCKKIKIGPKLGLNWAQLKRLTIIKKTRIIKNDKQREWKQYRYTELKQDTIK